MSDFSLLNYTYDDIMGDAALLNFSINRDFVDKIPLIKMAQLLQPNLKIIVTPWTAPAWLKTSGFRGNGTLLDNNETFVIYANYLLRCLQAYADANVTVDYLTLQNEPLHDDCGNMPCMSLSTDQAIQLAMILGPHIDKIRTRLLAYDHNWDIPDYPITILKSEAGKYFAGTAFHCYAGDVIAQTLVNNEFPQKEMHVTECSGGTWSPNFGSNLIWEMQTLFIGNANNFGQSTLYWNLALNEVRLRVGRFRIFSSLLIFFLLLL